MASLRPFRHALHEDRAPQGAAAPMAPAGAFAWRPRVYFGTPFTRIVHHRELYLWPQWVRSHGVPTPISAHPSRGSCPPRSSTYGPSGCVRMASPRPFRHTRLEDRAPQGAAPTAPVGAVAWCPRAHFGTALTRIVPHWELYPWPQWVRSHGVPAPISARLSRGSCLQGAPSMAPVGP